MRSVFACVMLFLYLNSLNAQLHPGRISKSLVPQPSFHYQDEYNFDTSINIAAWKNVSPGLNIAFGSTDELYFRSEVPDIAAQQPSANVTAWKNERVNLQLLIWSADTLNQIRIRIGSLKSGTGKTIAASAASAKMVRYVVSNYPYAAKDVTCGESPYDDLYLMPDRFEDFERFDLPGRTVRPVWITIDIPPTSVAGSYKGEIEVITERERTKLPITVQVQNQLLPSPKDWKHRLDLWQNPWVIAWKNNLKPWTVEHKLLLKQHLQLYANAGGKFITTYAVHSPWTDNSYMIEGGMIEWIKTNDGKWRFDYKIFDEYVKLAMSVGINKAITIYTPIPWGNRFIYTDQNTGNQVTLTLAPGTKEFADAWNIFLTDLRAHLIKQGWLNITYLGINENAMEHTLAAIKVIKAHNKDWKITYAGDWHEELDLLLDDYSFLYGKESNAEVVKNRSRRGQTTSYYVCCNPPVPNNFVFSPPVEGRWISWYTLAHGYDGFLRWAYDAWPADPQRDARHVLWPAGDCFLVYPGAASCIRFEKLREGITDFEKIRILREKASKSKNGKVKDLLAQLETHLQKFLNEKDFNKETLKKDLAKGNEMIAELSGVLN